MKGCSIRTDEQRNPGVACVSPFLLPSFRYITSHLIVLQDAVDIQPFEQASLHLWIRDIKALTPKRVIKTTDQFVTFSRKTNHDLHGQRYGRFGIGFPCRGCNCYLLVMSGMRGDGMNLRLATWNINSVRLRIGIVEHFLKTFEPDILCLQEIKCVDELFPYEAVRAAGYPHIHVKGQAGYHGVAIFSRLPLEDATPLDRHAVRTGPGFGDLADRIINGLSKAAPAA